MFVYLVLNLTNYYWSLIHRSAQETPNKKSGHKCSVASAMQESQGIARGFRIKEGEHSSLFPAKQQ